MQKKNRSPVAIMGHVISPIESLANRIFLMAIIPVFTIMLWT